MTKILIHQFSPYNKDETRGKGSEHDKEVSQPELVAASWVLVISTKIQLGLLHPAVALDEVQQELTRPTEELAGTAGQVGAG